jgi:hypothetical protein
VPSFSVNITTNTTPAVTINVQGGSTYGQFKNSLGNFDYRVDKTYLVTNNLLQIQGNFRYLKYDVNGNQNLQTILSVIDPYQFFNSLFIDTSDKNLILDGRDYVRFNLLPNTNLQIKLYAERVSNQDKMDLINPNNFKVYENLQGTPDFFDQYTDFL